MPGSMDKANFAPQGAPQVTVHGGIPRLGGMSLRTGQGDTSFMPAAAQPQMAVAQPGGSQQIPRGAQMVSLAGQPAAQPPAAPPQRAVQRPAMGDREVRLITVHAKRLDGNDEVAEYEVELTRGSQITGVTERLLE